MSNFTQGYVVIFIKINEKKVFFTKMMILKMYDVTETQARWPMEICYFCKWHSWRICHVSILSKIILSIYILLDDMNFFLPSFCLEKMLILISY